MLRGTISSLVRFEHRDITNGSTTSSWRFRTRLELAYPVNRPKLTVDGALYLTEDTEWFVPMNEDPQQGRIDQWRVRAGVGYRWSFRTRLETLHIWTTERAADTSQFATDSRTIDVRVKLAF